MNWDRVPGGVLTSCQSRWLMLQAVSKAASSSVWVLFPLRAAFAWLVIARQVWHASAGTESKA